MTTHNKIKQLRVHTPSVHFNSFYLKMNVEVVYEDATYRLVDVVEEIYADITDGIV